MDWSVCFVLGMATKGKKPRVRRPNHDDPLLEACRLILINKTFFGQNVIALAEAYRELREEVEIFRTIKRDMEVKFGTNPKEPEPDEEEDDELF